MDWDLLVLGAGTTGMACAIAAADEGAVVAVVERSDRVGGTLHVSGGHLSGAGTRRQRERGIEDSPDAHYADVMRICRETADPALVRLAVDEAAATLDWLDEHGFEADPTTPAISHSHEPYSTPRTVWGVELGRSILKTMLPLWEAHVAAGLIVPVLEHALAGFLVEDDRVVDAAVDGADGPLDVRADGTVLATGGYAASRELFRELTPGAPELVTAASPTSTGDGIRAARAAGAAIRGGDRFIPQLGGFEQAPGRLYDWPHFAVLSPVVRPPRELHVNAHGARFHPEDDPSPDARERAVWRQPGRRFWLVFDEAALVGGPSFHRTWNADEIRRRAHQDEIAWTSHSLEKLAERAGLDPGGLRATVDAWNASSPRWPVATPPFYATVSPAGSLVSYGGVTVDADLRVVGARGEPIPGLYAAGEAIGAGATMGNSMCGGMVVTPALTFRRILGRRLAVGASDPVGSPGAAAEQTGG